MGYSSASSAGTRRGLLGILTALILYFLYRQDSLLRYQFAGEATDNKNIQDSPFYHQSNGSFLLSNHVKRKISQSQDSSLRNKASSLFPASSKQHVEPQPRGVSFPQENTYKPKHDVSTILSKTSTNQYTLNTKAGPNRKWTPHVSTGGSSSQ